MKSLRETRIGLRVTVAEKEIIESVTNKMGGSMVDAVMKLFNDYHGATVGKAIAAAEIGLEKLVAEDNVNHFTITSVVGSIPEYVMPLTDRMRMVLRITGKSPSQWEKEAQQALTKSEV